MEVNELKGEMDRQFEGVARQFDAVARQFEAVHQRFEAVDRRFEAVDRRFEETLAVIATEGEKTRRHMLEEGERTRRHFVIVVEQIKSERNLALDKAIAADERTGRLAATNAADHVGFQARLDDHELRLMRLERKEDS